MKIGTIIFTYHRSEHTKKVVEALKKNNLLPQKLYIFQDGRKESTDVAGWEKVNRIIREIDWCEKELHISKKNKGLAKSVVEGVSHVLKECEAVIVLEDDCVPHKQFMQFMVSALHIYKEQKKVYSVSGYSWDIHLSQREADAYFNGRICSYGWGTWEDRWSQYEEDYNIITKIKNNPKESSRLQIWGQDLEGMLAGNVLGKCNSWAAFWALKVIEKGGYCLSPYKQLIDNIGYDGSGEHCVQLQEQTVNWKDKESETFQFPQRIEICRECEEEFKFLFSGKHGEEKLKAYQKLLIQWIHAKQMGQRIQIPKEWDNTVAVWGKGEIFDCLFVELQGNVSIKYIIESRPSEKESKGIPIISITQLPEDIHNIIVIPYFDLDIIRAKIERLCIQVNLIGIHRLLNVNKDENERDFSANINYN